jgi:signal transduction histidine kinase
MSDNQVQDNKLQILGKLTASLLHEIRNPLSAVKLNIDYLNMLQDEMNDEIRESVLSCRDAVERMEILVNSLLDFSRKSQNGFEIGDINQITENALEILHGAILKRNISVDKKLDHSLPNFYFNRNKVLQVFINLISNATEAVEEKGTIKLNTFLENSNDTDFLVWEIEDNGIGIKSENQEKIFNDFYTSKDTGTGLGLSVCKRIIDEHDAKIILNSEYGKGTKFKIIFNPTLLREKYED